MVIYEKIVKEDLELGYGTVSITNPAGGSLLGTKIGIHTLAGAQVLNANDFSGSTPNAKVVAASAQIASGIVIVGSEAGAISGLSNRIPALDLRATSDIIGSATTDPSRAPLLLIDHSMGDFTTFPLTGTVTLTNSATTVTGVGTAFLTQLQNKLGRAIKLNADGVTTWARVASVASDTVATLSHNYTGTGGAGAASYQTTNLTFAVRNTVTGGTADDALTGESVGLTVVSNRTAGNRGIYGANFNTSYSTTPTPTTGQAVGLEVDLSNNSGSDDTTGMTTLGVAILSGGTKKPHAGISVNSTTNYATNANNWLRGAFITGWSGSGVFVQGLRDHIQLFTAEAPNSNPQIGGRNITDSNYLWYIANDGTNSFPKLNNSYTYTSPAVESQGQVSEVILKETSADNDNAGTGVTSRVSVAATNTKNWIAVGPGALRGVIGQPIIRTGATGTVTAASAFISNPIVEAGTLTTLYGFYAMAPSGAGTVTNKISYFGEPNSGIAVFPRISAGTGTGLVAGDFALSAGWGGTGAVSAVIGTDQGWKITVTCGGSGIGASPTITLTFKNGTWTNSPIVISKMSGGTGTITDLLDAASATTWVMTFNGTPVNTMTYIISGIVMGR